MPLKEGTGQVFFDFPHIKKKNDIIHKSKLKNKDWHMNINKYRAAAQSYRIKEYNFRAKFLLHY